MLPCALEALRASEAQNQRAHVMLQTRCSRRDAQLQVLTQRLQEREFVMRAENSRQIEEFSSKFRALQQHLHSQVFMRAMDHLCQSVIEFKGLHSLHCLGRLHSSHVRWSRLTARNLKCNTCSTNWNSCNSVKRWQRRDWQRWNDRWRREGCGKVTS